MFTKVLKIIVNYSFFATNIKQPCKCDSLCNKFSHYMKKFIYLNILFSKSSASGSSGFECFNGSVAVGIPEKSIKVGSVTLPVTSGKRHVMRVRKVCVTFTIICLRYRDKGQFHQHFTRSFYARIQIQKAQKGTFWDQRAGNLRVNMWVKSTEDRYL